MGQSRLAALAIIASALICSTLAHAQYGRGEERPRNQGGSVNMAPADPILEVVSIDSYARVVTMRGPGGRTVNVQVGQDIYDLSKLAPGQKVQVNFLIPDDGSGKQLKAANIWPVQ